MAFIFGILASFFALLMQGFVWIFYPDLFSLTVPLSPSILFALLYLAFAEECSRIIFSNQYLKNNTPRYFFLSALFFGMGFASLEILLTFWNGFSPAVFMASFFHILATFITFWWLRESRTRPSVITILVLLTVLHTLFNMAILYFLGS